MPVRLRHRPEPTGRGIARPLRRLLGFVAAIALLVLSAREPPGRVEDDPLATWLDALTHNRKLTSARSAHVGVSTHSAGQTGRGPVELREAARLDLRFHHSRPAFLGCCARALAFAALNLAILQCAFSAQTTKHAALQDF
jgi:hypothetical protein